MYIASCLGYITSFVLAFQVKSEIFNSKYSAVYQITSSIDFIKTGFASSNQINFASLFTCLIKSQTSFNSGVLCCNSIIAATCIKTHSNSLIEEVTFIAINSKISHGIID